MFNSVIAHIEKQGFFTKRKRPICATSGGVDSMVLASILHRARYQPIIAHVDHGLRGLESDADYEHVKQWSSERNLEFLSLRVNVNDLRKSGESIQMAARRIRYDWFNELLEKYSEAELATAHHSDDSVETLLIGMLRGTGVRGLVGIPERSGRIVRPLLRVSRSEIEDYAKAEQIPFREDKSNQDSKYLRSRIRHELLPLIEELSGNSKRPLKRFVGLVGEMAKVFSVNDFISCKEQDGTHWYLLEKLNNDRLCIAQLLHQEGLHPDMIERVVEALASSSSGQRFNTPNGELLVGNDRLVFGLKGRSGLVDIAEDSLDFIQCDFLEVERFKIKNEAPAFCPEYAFLDVEKCNGKIQLRTWRNGDRMHPWGMKGSKLISDLLNEAKLSSFQKEDALVLIINNRIVWLVGIRIAEGFGVTPSTQEVYKLEYLPRNRVQESKEYANGLETLAGKTTNFESDKT